MGAYGTWLLIDGHADMSGLGAPYAYAGSHIVPDTATAARGGWVEVGVVPNHVVAHRAGAGPDIEADAHALAQYKAPGIRLGVHGQEPETNTVVLDRAQVQALRDCLTSWLDAEVAW